MKNSLAYHVIVFYGPIINVALDFPNEPIILCEFLFWKLRIGVLFYKRNRVSLSRMES